MRRADTLIVGGGPAGAAAAIRLAQGGQRPLILERHREAADALCGGFLSWTTLAALEKMGIERSSLGGQPVERMAMFSGGRAARAWLPAPAVGVSRRRLDAILLDRAEQAGARVERGVAARAFEGRELVIADGAILPFERMVLATGKHDLRGLARPQVEADARMVGLRWRLGISLGLSRMLTGVIELHCFRGGYAGLVLQEEMANLCLAVTQERLAEEGTPEDLLLALARECPELEARLAAAADMRGRQAIANMPYGWRALATQAGIYRIGDQAGVIPSLAGEGIAIALASGDSAAKAILNCDPAEQFQFDLARRLRRPIGVAGAITGLAKRPAVAGAMVRLIDLSPALARIAAELARVRQD